jgi:hypothetical protein
VATNVTGAYDLSNLSGFTSSGMYGSGLLATAGAGSRLVWYPGKAAFRAGNVTGPQWDDGNIAQASVALGFDTVASEFGSVAMGVDTVASGSRSVALGQGTTASGAGAFAVGQSNTASGFTSVATGVSSDAIGSSSVAMGLNTTASGFFSTAFGGGTTASGEGSLSAGSGTTASGNYSFAMGANNEALGEFSTAIGTATSANSMSSIAMGEGATSGGRASVSMGFNTVASGQHSVALGFHSIASGDYSVALGHHASANGNAGSFVFGDSSSVNAVVPGAANQFVVRAAGGVTIYTAPDLLAGVFLNPGDGAWSQVSDARMKTNFRDLDGEDVLARLGRVPIREWNYISQDASIRHVGPTAQDFHAAFGLGSSDRRISTLDPDGIALKAIQALDARTRRLDEEHAALREALLRENAALKEELAALRALIMR